MNNELEVHYVDVRTNGECNFCSSRHIWVISVQGNGLVIRICKSCLKGINSKVKLLSERKRK